MSTTAWVVLAAVIVAAVAVIGFVLRARMRTQRLRRRFGPEYDHALQHHGDRKAAERDLLARAERHRELEIRPLDPRARERYQRQWAEAQERFVDEPTAAVSAADALLTTVMAERGYPTSEFEERIATLSVDHARTLDHYRKGHEISARADRRQASTEDLRQAMVHYRALFEELLAAPDAGTVPASAGDAHGEAGPATRRHADGGSGPADRDRSGTVPPTPEQRRASEGARPEPAPRPDTGERVYSAPARPGTTAGEDPGRHRRS